ncbi:Tdrd12p [Desmophyllum pertusum]|uniref:Tdrd12p n=1 Tax=Desmophyllum pertusum TaxID=174260 RepID=A0A9X0CV47_9CNID|nr:Tdrd12p [Desmophyllum pertusum]
MATTLDVEIFKVMNAGNFWAHPIASPGSEFQDFMGKLNDHFRQSTTSQAVTQILKGQMCVIRRTSDSCWYRARVQNVLQTLSGPQASVFLVDLAESTLVPCCWIREVPAVFQNIPVQAMECFLIGPQTTWTCNILL